MGHKPGSVLQTKFIVKRVIIYLGRLLPNASGGFATRLEKDQPLSHYLAPNRGLPSQHLSMLLVRSYRTLAPLPVRYFPPLAVCFCGTILTLARTGRYPASLVFREPGLSSDRVLTTLSATTSPTLSHLLSHSAQ